MSGWNTTGVVEDWNAGSSGGDWNSGAATGGDWNDGGNVGTSGFDNANEFSAQDARNDVSDSGCRNCGQEGHFARECPEPRKTGACFNCGEEGHSKVDCTKPRKFTGTCHGCGEEGHAARDCPNKPKICTQCLQEGHEAIECKNPMVIDNSKVLDMAPADAWAMLQQASDEKDLDDFKDAIKILVKAAPSTTWPELEKEFRKRNFKIYLIAMERDPGEAWTIVNLQGDIGKKYTVGYYYSDKPQRPIFKDKWPETSAANLERLADAGIPVNRGIPKCNNCNQMGHTARSCSEDKVEIDHVKITCMLCGEEGHRVRHCQQERQKPREPRACKICEETDHLAKDCPNKPKRACHKCGSEDHMAKECDIIKCRNCDEIGHEARDCTAPRDWSRVKCRNCGQMGHGIKRCEEPIKEDENASGSRETFPTDTATNGFDSGTGGGSNEWNTSATAGTSGHNEWETGQAAPVITSGGW